MFMPTKYQTTDQKYLEKLSDFLTGETGEIHTVKELPQNPNRDVNYFTDVNLRNKITRIAVNPEEFNDVYSTVVWDLKNLADEKGASIPNGTIANEAYKIAFSMLKDYKPPIPDQYYTSTDKARFNKLLSDTINNSSFRAEIIAKELDDLNFVDELNNEM